MTTYWEQVSRATLRSCFCVIYKCGIIMDMKKGIVAIKHKAVLNNLVKNVGKKGKGTMKKAMIDAGYSKSYAEKGAIQKSKTWIEIMEEYLPDNEIAITHQKLLKAKQIRQLNFNYKLKDFEIQEILEAEGYKFIGTKRFMTTATVFFSAPDGIVIRGALDLAYKIKGKNAPEKFEVENTGLQSLSDAELMALINKQKARFNKTD